MNERRAAAHVHFISIAREIHPKRVSTTINVVPKQDPPMNC